MQKKIYFSCTYRKKAVPLHAFSQQMSNDKCQMTKWGPRKF